MTARHDAGPVPRLATDPQGAARVDELLARRRAELARLALAARTATRRREEAEEHLAAHLGTDEGREPADLLAVVDTMIERAVRACDDALAAARRDADETVALAVAASIEQLRRAGADASRVPAARWSALVGRDVAPPPSAGELWRRVGGGRPTSAVAAPSGVGVAAGDHADGPGGATWPDGPIGHAAPVLPESSLPAPEAFATVRATTATLVAEPAPADDRRPDAAPSLDLVGGSAGADEVFDMFWQEARQERRVRNRLRRRGGKEGSQP